eukprot:8275914-Pyramimonas_sp.AAC.1
MASTPRGPDPLPRDRWCVPHRCLTVSTPGEGHRRPNFCQGSRRSGEDLAILMMVAGRVVSVMTREPSPGRVDWRILFPLRLSRRCCGCSFSACLHPLGLAPG